MASKHGQVPVIQLSAAVELGWAGATADTTVMFNIAGQTNGRLWIYVYANTNITIDSGEYWYIEFQAFTADTAASADSPYSTTNAGGVIGASGTSNNEAHYYLLHKTSADGALAFIAGDLIAEFGIPDTMCRLVGYDWVQLTNITDAADDNSSIDVLVVDRG